MSEQPHLHADPNRVFARAGLPVTVAQLLAHSQRAHLRAQQCRKARDVFGHLGCMSEALEYRLRAHYLDPLHRESIWQEEQTQRFQHDRCLAFYFHELGIPPEQGAALLPAHLPESVTDAA